MRESLRLGAGAVCFERQRRTVGAIDASFQFLSRIRDLPRQKGSIPGCFRHMWVQSTQVPSLNAGNRKPDGDFEGCAAMDTAKPALDLIDYDAKLAVTAGLVRTGGKIMRRLMDWRVV